MWRRRWWWACSSAASRRIWKRYLLGDRDLPWWAILGSIVATETSAATVLSVPGQGYGPIGMKFLQIALGYIVGRAIIVYVLLPLYFRGQLLTAYEVLEQRFGGLTRRAASLLFLIARNLGDGLRLFLVAIVLQKLTGLPFAWSVVVMGVVATVYTFVGGMRSVIWNDCIQFGVYVLGAIAAVFVIANSISGGWAKCCGLRAESGKLRLFDFRLSLSEPYTFWAGADRRRVPDDRHARHRPLDGAALSERPEPGRRRAGHFGQRLSRARCSSPCSCSSASSWPATTASIRPRRIETGRGVCPLHRVRVSPQHGAGRADAGGDSGLEPVELAEFGRGGGGERLLHSVAEDAGEPTGTC